MLFNTLPDYTPCVGEGFELDLGEASHSLTLIEAIPLAVRPYPGMVRPPFSLKFRSASQVVLPQRIYVMKTVQWAKPCGLFISPIGRDVGGVIYQAVFN